MTFDDETLMAYVDGELDAETRARVDAALVDDPSLADRLAVFLGTADLLAPLDATLEEPVPPTLLPPTLRQATLPPAPLEPPPARAVRAPEPLLARLLDWLGGPRGLATGAAGLVLGAAVVLALGPTPSTGPGPMAGNGPAPTGNSVADALDPALIAVLDEGPSGQRRAIEGRRAITPVMTIAAADGNLCREFSDLHTAAAGDARLYRGLACRSPGSDWQLRARIATSVAPSGDGDYQPASSGTEAFDALVESLAPGSMLSAGDEAALIARNWQR